MLRVREPTYPVDSGCPFYPVTPVLSVLGNVGNIPFSLHWVHLVGVRRMGPRHHVLTSAWGRHNSALNDYGGRRPSEFADPLIILAESAHLESGEVRCPAEQDAGGIPLTVQRNRPPRCLKSVSMLVRLRAAAPATHAAGVAYRRRRAPDFCNGATLPRSRQRSAPIWERTRKWGAIRSP